MCGGTLEDRRRWGDLRLGGPQDRIRVGRPPGGQGVTVGSPIQVLAGRHRALPPVDPLAECMVLRGQVADPGGRLGELAVGFTDREGCFGGEQRLDRLAGVSAAQYV